MLPDYEDIRSRITEPPKWFDRHGVPRYCDPIPNECSNIYANVVVFYRIRCQACGEKFVVESVEDSMQRAMRPERLSLLDIIHSRALHYGDPPRHGDGCGGDTMNCEDERVMAVWVKQPENRFDWVRLSQYDGWDLEDADAEPREVRS